MSGSPFDGGRAGPLGFAGLDGGHAPSPAFISQAVAYSSASNASLREDKLFTQAGGGVVWDSTPEGEYQETVNKARAIWSAAEHAARFDGSGNR